MTYLLDANVFISASRLHYGFDFCPAFWDWLVESNQAKRVFAINNSGNGSLRNACRCGHGRVWGAGS